MQVRSLPLGAVLIAWIAVTALIALNRGIDLLWGVTILLSVATLLALVLPKFQLRGISVRRVDFPTTAVVGCAETIGYEVEVRGWWPRFGVEIQDRLQGQERAEATAFLARTKGRKTHTFRWTPGMRGCWQLRDIALESRYPLGLARSSRMCAAEQREIIVYPDFVQLHWLPVRNDAHPRFEHMVSPRRGGHDELFGLKSYAAGDEMRAIHWRMTARRGEIVVKEYEHHQDRQLWIVLDLAEAQHVGRGVNGSCEQMIRIAHSVAVKACETGIPVGLVYRVADQVMRVPAAADRATYLRIRDVLARIGLHAQLPLVRWAQRFREQLPSGGTWVIFNLGDAAERAALERSARQRLAAPLFVEFDKRSYVEGAQQAGDVPRVRTHASARGIVSTVARGADLSELFKP